MAWVDNDDYLTYTSTGFKFNKYTAMFDLDDTLIKTKSGAIFAKHADDWKFFNDNVPTILKHYHDNNYTIIIVTNQGGLSTNDKLTSWKLKISNILANLSIPVKILVGLKTIRYRKPLPYILTDNIDYTTLYKSKIRPIFYCGDACGRNSDHSDCDYKFAINLDIDFVLPDIIFADVKCYKHKYNTYTPPALSFDIRDYVAKHSTNTLNIFDKYINKPRTMIMLIGFPGCGKSYVSNYVKSRDNSYEIINGDVIGSKAKQLKQLHDKLHNDINVIIDNTMLKLETRTEYIAIANKYNYTVIGVHIDVPIDVAFHNNTWRAINNLHYVPTITYNVMRKSYTAPKLSDGFTELITYEPSYEITKLSHDYLFHN